MTPCLKGLEAAAKELLRLTPPHLKESPALAKTARSLAITAGVAIKAYLEHAEGHIRTQVIEEICNNYYQPIIDNFRAQRNLPEIGYWAHENDIKLYERLQRDLRAQEWIAPLPTPPKEK